MLHALRLALTAFLSFAPAIGQSQTHGQMIGETTSNSAVAWTRASQACFASVQFATSPTFAGATETAQYPATAARDFTVRIPLVGLVPDTRYYYRFRLSTQLGMGGGLTSAGSFRTAPDSAIPHSFRFAFSGDVQTLADYGIFATLHAMQPAFYVSLGDFPYCDGATTLAQYWTSHQARRSEAQWQLFSRDVPIFATWDDHEVVNNWDAATSIGLVAAGTQAFRDWWPIADAPTQIYRRFRYGDAELFLLDTRRFRGLNAGDPAPGKPLLGAPQLGWLCAGLRQSTATWKFVATSVPTFYGGTDSWDGYVHERESLLAYLRAQDVHNVVFLAADQHIAAIRELREGLVELQAGPMAQFLGGNVRNREPEERWVGNVRNFAMIEVDATSSPTILRVAFHDAAGGVLREHSLAPIGVAAGLRVECDEPEGAFLLADGPHFVRDAGTTAGRERLHPGTYRLHWRDLPWGDGTPAGSTIAVPDGAQVRVAASYRDQAGANPVLFADSFDAPFGAPAGWTVVDQTTATASAWLVVDGALTQRTNIGSGGAPLCLGTTALAGDPAWSDVTIRGRIRSVDNDSCGFVFRHTGPGDYYRLRLDAERQTIELSSFVNGAQRILAQRAVTGFTPRHWHGIEIAAVGNRLRVWRDGEPIFNVLDADHAVGRFGCWCWADQIVAFDDLVVRAGDATTASRATAFRTDFANGSLAAFSIVDQGAVEGPSSWAVTNAELVQASNINDGDGSTSGLPKLGTMAIAGPVLGDQELRVRVYNGDDDALGAVVRYVDPQNYYRFSLDAQRGYRRLVKFVQGQPALLWEDRIDHLPGVWHELTLSARGDLLRVGWDGLTLCEVQDTSLPNGRAGLYCWAGTGVRFDDFTVQAPPAPRATLVAIDHPGRDELAITAPESAGGLYILALSGGRQPGMPMSSLQPADPRTWPLNPDAWFFASLQPSPFLQQFVGTLDVRGLATATVLVPPGAAV
ncbi:MAG: hypothetical protein RL398_1629, partial [Planctomycetota bacterium]